MACLVDKVWLSAAVAIATERSPRLWPASRAPARSRRDARRRSSVRLEAQMAAGVEAPVERPGIMSDGEARW
jgi:hypothetical protein